MAEMQTLQANMLSVTSRGIGINTVHLTYLANRFIDPFSGRNRSEPHLDYIMVPDIYSQFRAYLALFEAKVVNIKRQFPLVPRFIEAINPHDPLIMNAEFRTITSAYTFVPTPIKRIIDVIGIVKQHDKVYLPVVAETPHVSPESTVLSNLRATVVALSNPTTPQNIRQRYKENCAIPGAIWNDNILVNPDDIMPEDYTYEDGLQTDLMRIVPYLHSLQKYFPKMVGGPLDTKVTGKKSLFVSNEMETLRCPDRRLGEELNAYYNRCIEEGNIRQYTSIYKLTAADTSEGQVNLLGERPTLLNLMRPIYSLRDSVIHSYTMHAEFKGACSYMYNS